MKKTIILSAMMLSLAGCATQVAYVNARDGDQKADEMQTFFVEGIGQTQSVDAAKVCGGANKVAKVERVQTFVDVVLRQVTLGIYTPHHAKVYCTR